MRSVVRYASLTAASALVISIAPGSAVAAQPCASSAEVRTQVSQLVAGLRDDVKSSSGRSAVAHALVEVHRTLRGEKADTPQEARGLGKEVSALARQLKDANSKVERAAIIAEMKALKEQRGRGPLTDEERAELRAAVVAIRTAVVNRTDTKAERRELVAQFRELREQAACHG